MKTGPGFMLAAKASLESPQKMGGELSGRESWRQIT